MIVIKSAKKANVHSKIEGLKRRQNHRGWGNPETSCMKCVGGVVPTGGRERYLGAALRNGLFFICEIEQAENTYRALLALLGNKLKFMPRKNYGK